MLTYTPIQKTKKRLRLGCFFHRLIRGGIPASLDRASRRFVLRSSLRPGRHSAGSWTVAKKIRGRRWRKTRGTTRRDETNTRRDEHARTGWNGTRSSGSAIAGERDRVEAQARTTTNAHELGRREDYQSGDDDGVHDDAHRGDSWRSG